MRVSVGHSEYLTHAFGPVRNYRALVNRTARLVRKVQKELGFHAIAFTGESGASMAYPVKLKTGIPIINVRKDNVNSHGQAVEGPTHPNIKKYIILDDFVSTGNTVEDIIITLEYKAPRLECVGAVFYAWDWDTFGLFPFSVKGEQIYLPTWTIPCIY